jgi:predicted RecB family nuclease
LIYSCLSQFHFVHYADYQINNSMNTDGKLISIFGNVQDPRSHINQLHDLVDILLIGIISVICGAELRSISRKPKLK